jgi:hypothetical protein
MAILIHCYNVVVAAPRRLLAHRPRVRHLIPGKRTVRRAAAGKAAATGGAAKTILVCTVSGLGLGGLGYGGYRALAGNAPAGGQPNGGQLAGGASGFGPELGAPLPFEFDTANLLGDASKFVTPEMLTGGETIIQTQPNEIAAPVPEPPSAWILFPALLLLGIVQWRITRGKK